MRGKDKGIDLQKAKNRITPAHAGKSERGWWANLQVWDHPRACGEKAALGECNRWQYGSPPRMRGKAIDGTQSHVLTRITPAHAGKSLYLT